MGGLLIPYNILLSYSIFIAVLVFFYFWHKYLLKDRKYIRKQIEALDIAIMKQDKFEAYNSFKFLKESFKIKSSSNYFIKVVGRGAIIVEWMYLKEAFLDILHKYKSQSSLERDMSSEETDKLIEKLRSQIEKSGEYNCLSCGAVLHEDENKCPKCGWSWKDK